MTKRSLGLTDHLQEYLLAVSLRESEVLRKLREVTEKRDDSVMQIAPEQGQFLALLIRLLSVERILEVGTFTGYSSLVMAEALPEHGRIVTLDLNEETGDIARKFWNEAGLGGKIEQRLGPAIETLEKLDGPFDLVFIDADKGNYDSYYEKGLRLLKPGGLLVIDNVLWSGRVADSEARDLDTMTIKNLNERIHGDERVDLSLIPVADGLTLLRKRFPKEYLPT